MIEPNRLSPPGEAAARARVEAVFARIDELSPAELDLVVIRPPDPDTRDPLIEELESAADRHGRGELLDEARDAVRDNVFRRISTRFPSDRITGGPRPSGSTEDLAGLVVVLQDLVAVAATEDLIDPPTARALAGPGRTLLGLPGEPEATTPTDDPRREPATPSDGLARPAPAGTPAWAPTRSDWAAADRGETSVDRDAEMPGVRGLRMAFFGVVGVAGALAALVAGIADGQPVLGALGAMAVAAVCWTLATFRRAR